MTTVRDAKLDELTPDAHNANVGTERGRYLLDHSLRQYGAGRSILLDREGRVIAGNKTIEAAADIGLEDVVIVQTEGDKLVAVQRTDLDLEDGDRARLLAYADNRSSEVGLVWGAEQIEMDLEDGLDLSALFRPEEMEIALAIVDPFGNVSTDRYGQGVSSTWDQVKNAEADRVIVGTIESRLPQGVIDMLVSLLVREYEERSRPIFETLESVIVMGVRAFEAGDH